MQCGHMCCRACVAHLVCLHVNSALPQGISQREAEAQDIPIKCCHCGAVTLAADLARCPGMSVDEQIAQMRKMSSAGRRCCVDECANEVKFKCETCGYLCEMHNGVLHTLLKNHESVCVEDIDSEEDRVLEILQKRATEMCSFHCRGHKNGTRSPSGGPREILTAQNCPQMTLKLTLFFALFPLFFVIFLPEFTKFSPFSQKISEIFREFLKSAANSQKTRFGGRKQQILGIRECFSGLLGGILTDEIVESRHNEA